MKRLLILSIALLFVACGGDDQTQPETEGDQSPEAVIEVTGLSFPETFTVPAGQPVMFANNSGGDHTVTFATMDGEPFDATFELGNTAELSFPLQPGEYEYFCSIHPVMEGTLIVEG